MNQTTDLRIYKTRKALCDTFMEMMKEKSFDSITVNELCERALVRRATFYKHFCDKFDFFSYFIRYVRDEYMRKQKPLAGYGSLSEFCIYYYDIFFDFAEANKPLIDNALKSNMLPTILDIFSEETYAHILKAISENQMQNDWGELSPEVFASFYSGAITYVFRQCLQKPSNSDKEALRKCIEVLLNSFIPKV